MDATDPHVDITLESDADGPILRVTGEIDAATSGALEAAISDAATRRPDGDTSSVRVDLSAVTFIDSSGLRALIVGHRDLDGALRVVAVSDVVQRLFEVTGLTETLVDASG